MGVVRYSGFGISTIGVSSSGKTQVFGTCIRRFESSHPSQLYVDVFCRKTQMRGRKGVFNTVFLPFFFGIFPWSLGLPRVLFFYKILLDALAGVVCIPMSGDARWA